MKINFFKYFISLFLILFFTIFYLSFFGIETNRFNSQIKTKVTQIDKNYDLDLKSINLKLDPLNFKIKLETIGTTVFYLNRPLALESINTEISLNSLIKKKIISSNVRIVSRSILLSDLIKFVRAQNNSLELLILQKIIKNGFIILDLNLNFDEKGKLKNDYILTGIVKDGKIELLKNNEFKNINFNFNLNNKQYLFNNIEFKKNNISFISKNLNVEKKDDIFLIKGSIKNKKSILKKKFLDFINIKLENIDLENTKFISKTNFSLELNKKFRFKKTLFESNIELDKFKYKVPNEVINYFTNLKNEIILKNNKLNFKFNNNKIEIIGNGEINFNNKYNKIEYSLNKIDKNIFFSSDFEIENINLKTQKVLRNYFPYAQDQINLKKHKVNLKFKNKNISLLGNGKIKIDKEYENINYFISQNKNNFIFDFGFNLNSTQFKIDKLNYKKKKDSDLRFIAKGNYNEDNIELNNLKLNENKNKIEINDLILGKNYQIKKLKSAYFNFSDVENKENEFFIKKLKKNTYKLDGSSINSNSLITNLIENEDEKGSQIFKNDINLIVDLEKVYIDEIYFINNLNGKVLIKNNEIKKANLKAKLKDNDKVNLLITTDEKDQKITTFTSTWAKPFVNRYKFINGFEEGYLDFYSSKINGISNSVLVIDNFKVKEISVLAKLLALASLQGIADLLTGEGIRFSDFEMKFSKNKKLMTIEELYAIGPSISILMDGYIQSKELISLRGTLVPASTVNRTIASIPLLGDFLVGKKVGEGVFGVSFKIKGPPKDLETTVNPIKTLTPRFITRTLEKIKKN